MYNDFSPFPLIMKKKAADTKKRRKRVGNFLYRHKSNHRMYDKKGLE